MSKPPITVTDLQTAHEATQHLLRFTAGLTLGRRASILRRSPDYWLQQAQGVLTNFAQVLTPWPAVAKVLEALAQDHAVPVAGVSGTSCHEAVWRWAHDLMDALRIALAEAAWEQGIEADPNAPSMNLRKIWTDGSWEALQTVWRDIPPLDVSMISAELECEGLRAVRALGRVEPGGSSSATVDPEMLALALLAKIGPNVSEIARQVNMPRTTLLGRPAFRRALERMQALGEKARRARPRGRRAGSDFELDH